MSGPSSSSTARSDQVSPLIRRVICNNPGPFTFKGTGTYIIGKGEGLAVIDPGPDLPAHLQAILDAVSGERVRHILITHHHLDHSPLAKPLAAATGAVIYGCTVKELPAEDGGVRVEAGYDHFTPDVSVCGGRLSFTGHGWTMEAILTPGHISNHICYALAEENASFHRRPRHGLVDDGGDAAGRQHGRLHGQPGADKGAQLQDPVADAWAADHGPRAVHRRIHRPPVPTTARGRFSPNWRPARPRSRPWCRACTPWKLGSMPSAARSVLAHMLELVRTGQVVTDGPPGPLSEYRLAKT